MIIDQLPEISTVQDTDEIPIERGTATYKTPLSKLWTRLKTVFIVDASTSADTTWSSNKIDTQLGGKQDTLTFDNVPTDSSNNPVKSGGVYTALAALEYAPGTYTVSLEGFGYITSDGKLCRMHFVLPKSVVNRTLSSVSAATYCGFRRCGGGYIGGSDATLTSYITGSSLRNGTLRVEFTNSGGWGATNNSPVVGSATITFKLT